MADQNHLEILKQGVDVWNAWLKENPTIRPDLSQADLPFANLAGADLSRADLRGSNLNGANLMKADLRSPDPKYADALEPPRKGFIYDEAYRNESKLFGTNLAQANLKGAYLSGTNLESTQLFEADLSETKLIRAFLNVAKLREAKLCKADLRWSSFKRADMKRANLEGAVLFEANLRGADLSEAKLNDANLHGANLGAANLNKADLSRSSLFHANLKGASLLHTSLRDTNLIDADLSEASLYQTDFSGAMMGYTKLGYIDLSNSIGLENIEHRGPSTIGIDTIIYSKGHISEKFLRGCGLNDLIIETTKLLTPGHDPDKVTDITYNIYKLYCGEGILYYSCFISYSSKDEGFAEQLYHDLQDNGVRCWFAPDDMKIGDPIRKVIDQQIRLREKLLLILSENSIKSEWVGDEVEAALDNEKDRDTLILFPVRLDDSVFNAKEDWAAKIRRRRHIGNFSDWKTEKEYEKGLEKLLSDLKKY